MTEKSFGGSKNTSKKFFWDFSSYISIHKKKVLQGRPSWHGSYACWPGYPDLGSTQSIAGGRQSFCISRFVYDAIKH